MRCVQSPNDPRYQKVQDYVASVTTRSRNGHIHQVRKDWPPKDPCLLSLLFGACLDVCSSAVQTELSGGLVPPRSPAENAQAEHSTGAPWRRDLPDVKQEEADWSGGEQNEGHADGSRTNVPAEQRGRASSSAVSHAPPSDAKPIDAAFNQIKQLVIAVASAALAYRLDRWFDKWPIGAAPDPKEVADWSGSVAPSNSEGAATNPCVNSSVNDRSNLLMSRRVA